MEPRRFIRSGIAASAIGHFSALALILIFAEVHPFGSVTAEPIAVDIVTPEETAPPKDQPTPKPPDAFELPTKAAPETSAAPAVTPAPTAPPSTGPASVPAPAAAAPPQRPAAPSAVRSDRPPLSSARAYSQGYAPPEPDISIKYHVILGLPQPMEIAQVPANGDNPGDSFDAQASRTADVASTLIAEFRRHLKTCSKLPDSVSPTDKIGVKLRVLMTTDGRLGANPIPIEGSASLAATELAQSAIQALKACQPYTMLPANRYGEWKVLDLSFTPGDFAS